MKPAIFNTAMVRAILDGRKTQTRRIFNSSKIGTTYDIRDGKILELCKERGEPDGCGGYETEIWEFDITDNFAPYKVGDVIYVRETFVVGVPDGDEPESESNPMTVFYKADDSVHGWMNEDWDEVNIPWKPSIHMPKEYARLFLRVKDIRIERLNEISEEDAIAEGVDFMVFFNIENGGDKPLYRDYKYSSKKWTIYPMFSSAKKSFGSLWESIYGNGSFDNRYVWAIEFEQISKEEAMSETAT